MPSEDNRPWGTIDCVEASTVIIAYIYKFHEFKESDYQSKLLL
jgi:hypothetical protein